MHCRRTIVIYWCCCCFCRPRLARVRVKIKKAIFFGHLFPFCLFYCLFGDRLFGSSLWVCFFTFFLSVYVPTYTNDPSTMNHRVLRKQNNSIKQITIDSVDTKHVRYSFTKCVVGVIFFLVRTRQKIRFSSLMTHEIRYACACAYLCVSVYSTGVTVRGHSRFLLQKSRLMH